MKTLILKLNLYLVVLCGCALMLGCGGEKYQASAILKPTSSLLNNLPPDDIRHFEATDDQSNYVKEKISEFTAIMNDIPIDGLRKSTVFFFVENRTVIGLGKC